MTSRMTSFLVSKSWFWNWFYQLKEASPSILVAISLKEHRLSFPKITRDSRIDLREPSYGARKIVNFHTFKLKTVWRPADKPYHLMVSPTINMFSDTQFLRWSKQKILLPFGQRATARAKSLFFKNFSLNWYDKLWTYGIIWRPLLPHIGLLQLRFDVTSNGKVGWRS